MMSILALQTGRIWIVASWKPRYEPADSIGDSEQRQQFLAKLEPSQQVLGPARRDADLTDDRQIQGNWIDSSHRCAHSILQEPHLRNMQAMGALETRLPPWLAQETTISEMHQDGEERDRTTDSLGITAPEDRLKMRPDIMMVDLITNDLSDRER